MRVVGLEADVVDAALLDVLEAVHVVEEAAVDLAVVVGARRLGHLVGDAAPAPVVLPDLVGPLEDVGDPADLALGVGELQRRAAGPASRENSQSVIELMALPNVSVEPTAAGASAEVDGIFDDEPMCMLMTVPVSAQARKKGSQ